MLERLSFALSRLELAGEGVTKLAPEAKVKKIGSGDTDGAAGAVKLGGSAFP